jgi:hypothetical protein
MLFYGGYGCLEKNGGKENNLRQMRHPQIEDVLGQLSLSDSFFFSPVFFRRNLDVDCTYFPNKCKE